MMHHAVITQSTVAVVAPENSVIAVLRIKSDVISMTVLTILTG